MADESVTVICYGQREVWENRKDAMNFYWEGVMACEGSERDRYLNVYLDLKDGLKICTDGV